MAHNENYEDQLAIEKRFTGDVTIPSKVITEPYIKVFMLYHERIEDRIFAFNPGLKPKKDVRGLRNDVFRVDFTSSSKRDSLRREYLKTFNTIYSVRIDSTDYDPEFIITQNFKNELGFETYINLDSLTNGKHLLKISRLRVKKGDTTNWI